MNPFLETGNVHKCTGCSSCANACPTKAITMKKDNHGFIFPEVNKHKCVVCNLCETTCHFSDKCFRLKNSNPDLFACKLTSPNALNNSSSGGLFYALASAIINQGGRVYGASWQENFKVKHIGIDKIDDIELLQGSKYVFSDLNNSFSEIKDLLNAGETILFTGTPCQVAGLYAYLKKDYSNLVTCDVICHGVPSQMYLDLYLNEMCKLYHAKINKINFKDKSISWRNPQLSIVFDNGTEYKEALWSTAYGKLYHERLTTMPACDECPYTVTPRLSDITIGDFWNYNETKNTLGSEKQGISCALINTEKGNNVFSSARSLLKVEQITLEDAMQLHLVRPATPASIEKKRRFEKYIKTNSICSTARRMNDYLTLYERIKRKLGM